MEHSFSILAEEYRPMVLAYLKALTKDAHLAEDLTQETFLAAQKGIAKLKKKGSFPAWLRGIAKNKVLDHARRSARQGLVVDSRILEGMEEVLQKFDPRGEDGAFWRDRLGVIRSCMGKLSEGLKKSVDQVYLNGKSLKEAAKALGVSFDAVGKRLSRARVLLRECVARNLEGGMR